jgi:hypothetical protein
MPLTAYSISSGKELDVEQLLDELSARAGIGRISPEDLPDAWRAHIRTDLECPCCFVTGAEIVREAVSRTSGRAVRQACFRFTVPGHHAHCDFASSERANATPDNLVAFGVANSNLTRAVRELVCTGIQSGVFSQRSIRDMREWFFHKKTEALIEVSLDPRVPKWIAGLWRITGYSFGPLPPGVSLTAEIASVPGFDWVTEAARRQRVRHHEILDVIQQQRLWIHDTADRIESLAKRYRGQVVFDPSVLAEEYGKSQALAAFISRNYDPIKPGNRNGSVAVCVLALSALLLFVSEWDLNRATATFAAIAAAAGRSDQSLGNVMGLNPFHDYEAWDRLKRLQALGITVPDNDDPKAELKQIEMEIRSQLLALPQTPPSAA